MKNNLRGRGKARNYNRKKACDGGSHILLGQLPSFLDRNITHPTPVNLFLNKQMQSVPPVVLWQLLLPAPPLSQYTPYKGWL